MLKALPNDKLSMIIGFENCENDSIQCPALSDPAPGSCGGMCKHRMLDWLESGGRELLFSLPIDKFVQAVGFHECVDLANGYQCPANSDNTCKSMSSCSEAFKIWLYAEAKHFAEWMLVRRVENVFDGEIERYNIVQCTNCGREQNEVTPFCPICGYEMTDGWSVNNG